MSLRRFVKNSDDMPDQFDEDGEPLVSASVGDHATTRERAIALKHEIDDVFAEEVEEALATSRARRQQRAARDTREDVYASEPPPRA